MRKRNKDIVSIHVSDLHLSSKCPVSILTDNWFDHMGYYLDQLIELCNFNRCPLVIAGDVFHKWNSSAELINWTIKKFKLITYGVYSIYGQHDMPYHSVKDMDKGSYNTLVYSGMVYPIGIEKPTEFANVRLFGFPYGSDIYKCPIKRDPMFVNVAVCHKYLWMDSHGYVGAKKEDHVNSIKDMLSTYDVVHFGDNHSGFITSVGDTIVLNSGCLMKRTLGEIGYSPSIGLLLSNGKMIRRKLNTEIDKFVTPNNVEIDKKVIEFVESISKLEGDSVNFESSLKEFFANNKVKKSVKRLILEALE